MPYLAAFAVWSLLGFTLFLVAAYAGGVERKHLMFVAVAPAVAVNLFIGQNGFFFAALLICGLINLDRRPLLAGLCFGLLTIKPQLGLLLPVMLVLTQRWRVIAAARRHDNRAGRRDLRDLGRRHLAGIPRQGRSDAALSAGERLRPAAAADPFGVLCRPPGRTSDPPRLDHPGRGFGGGACRGGLDLLAAARSGPLGRAAGHRDLPVLALYAQLRFRRPRPGCLPCCASAPT